MENSLKSLCRKFEYVSLKALSGPHKRAVRSLTPSIFDQVLLGVEGRTCGDGKRKLARESLLEPKPRAKHRGLPTPLLFLAPGLTGSGRRWRAELWATSEEQG